ncbi:MAG: RDD family protein [Vicinamibacterales bacterium]
MKCPKCEYLGFETGDRCKNCGYDFSLAVVRAAPQDRDLPLREPEPQRDPDRWLNQLEARLDNVRPVASSSTIPADPLAAMTLDARPAAPAAATHPAVNPTIHNTVRQPLPTRAVPALPLFQPGSADSDEPLIKVPAAPRPPLAVRRTPEKPRLRTVPKPRAQEADPVLAFAEEPEPLAAPSLPTSARPVPSRPRSSVPVTATTTSGPARRLIAAFIDLVILLSIDAIVIYFTFQIAGLPFRAWRTVPIVPLALFLMMVKGSYFSVFTMLGGQTVGKMATGIRVVTDTDQEVEPARAVQRTLAALASVATVGIGFAPVLFAGDRRALHDRVAGTRVVGPVHE